MKIEYWIQITVWERRDEGALVRYTCLQAISGQFAVLAADFFYAPANHKPLAEADARLLELLFEEDPFVRCTWFTTIEEAIRNHRTEFS